jgi:hypothetical protein
MGQAGGGEPLTFPPELSWNLKTDRQSVFFSLAKLLERGLNIIY